MENDYRSVCNAATLQSDSRGFFLNFADAVESEAGPDWLEAFRRLPNHQERIAVCLKDPKICQIVHGTLSNVQPIFRGKASRFAKSKLEEGEHWLRKGKPDRALASINLAVVRAPFKGENLSKEDLEIAPLSLWLRSEILFKMMEYSLAINDIQLAIKYHLPNKHKYISGPEKQKASVRTLRHSSAFLTDFFVLSMGSRFKKKSIWTYSLLLLRAEAFKRLGVCYLKTGEKKKAIISLNLAKTCGSTVEQEECSKILNDIDKISGAPINVVSPPSVAASLSDMPGLSSSLRIATNKDCGRYLTAGKPIGVGEFVSVEEPYVSALFTEKHGTHCLNCFKRLKAPLPCPNCSGVGFCSSECLNEGLKYHKWECPYMELMIGSGMSALSVLALRAITQQDLNYFKNAKSEDHVCQKAIKLEGHLAERDGRDLLRRTLMALFLLQILRHCGYFKSSSKKDRNKANKNSDDEEETIGKLSDDEQLIAYLILTHLIVMQFNCHEVYETILPKNKPYSQGMTNYIGLALYLGSSLFNHQCQPTLARYFIGKKIVLRAQRPLNVGEEVTENYGPVFTMRTKEQRQKVLNGRYLFTCRCKPCEEDWPTLKNMTPELAYYRCKKTGCPGSVSENGKCSKCKNKQNLEEDKLLFLSYQNDWERGADFVKDKNYVEAEKVLLQYVKDMWNLVNQPSKNLSLAVEALRTIWANSTGNISVLQVPDTPTKKN